MSDQEIKLGQIWRDTYGEKTSRNGRTIAIEVLVSNRIVALVLTREDGTPWPGVKRTTMKLRTLRAGYTLIEDAPR